MKNKIYLLVISLFISSILSKPSCIPYINNCEKCNPLTNLCDRCIADNYIKNGEGGCSPICKIGKNYCVLCDEQKKLCSECEEGFFPDQSGSCSIIENCKVSTKGKCTECISNYILVGSNYDDSYQICKNKNSGEFRNCYYINSKTGFCEVCEEGYFLTEGNSRCINIENCYESIFGLCIQCKHGYYLNKRESICLKVENSFYYCKQTLDGKNCDECNFGYYMAEDGQCSLSINCAKTNKGKCIECSNGFFLEENNICTNESNCSDADKDSGLCNYCKTNFYLDKSDRKCKINTENNELKYCKILENEICTECERGYYIGSDLKCVSTKNCLESELGICHICKEGFHLISNDKCSNIDHCLYAETNNYLCDECEDGYYYSHLNKTCQIAKDVFSNCRVAALNSDICTDCKANYYLNYSDYLCYDNTKDEKFFYCKSTNINGTDCQICKDGYFLSFDKKCGTVEKCKFYEKNNINRCKECDKFYCLNVKDGNCYENDFLEKEEDKIYVACLYTNEEGTACEKCLDGYEVGDNGYCVDVTRCEKRENGICVKCKEYEDSADYCANSVFGCLETFVDNCLKCDDLSNLYACTEFKNK